MNLACAPRFPIIFLFASLVFMVLAVSSSILSPELEFEGKAKSRDHRIHPEIVNSRVPNRVIVPPATPNGFTSQTRLGFTVGDQWEPAIAADRHGHVYMIYPQYGGVPGCLTCYSPTMILQTSSDHGQTWSVPRVIDPEGSTNYQVDAQISVDPADGSTVYVSWLQNNKSDIRVGKSTDFGVHWSFVIADHTNAGTDKPILAVQGQDVYVAYNHSQTAFVTFSHDGGATFTEVKMNHNANLGWSLATGGTVTPNGDVDFSWVGYTRNGQAKGNVNIYISKSTNGGSTWTTKLLDISSAPPDCSAFNCGWAYLAAAITIASDTSGNLYALWNASTEARGPARIYFSRSIDGGVTWSSRQDVSFAPTGTHHNFPVISSANSGDVRIAWMDARAASGGLDRWNVYYRSSTDGGSTWSLESDLSSDVGGFSYIFTDGFRFPFGDYFGAAVDEQGTNHFVWGEGFDWESPGSIWYSKGNS